MTGIFFDVVKQIDEKLTELEKRIEKLEALKEAK